VPLEISLYVNYYRTIAVGASKVQTQFELMLAVGVCEYEPKVKSSTHNYSQSRETRFSAHVAAPAEMD
jgi:hypothetical protein